MRVITSSNSFDLKSNPAALANRFQMSAEAAKLFETLQESPLPLPDANEEVMRASLAAAVAAAATPPAVAPIIYHKALEEKHKWLEAPAGSRDRNMLYG